MRLDALDNWHTGVLVGHEAPHAAVVLHAARWRPARPAARRALCFPDHFVLLSCQVRDTCSFQIKTPIIYIA
jgi:hypothetical protein